jgi:hypothetical protein
MFLFSAFESAAEIPNSVIVFMNAMSAKDHEKKYRLAIIATKQLADYIRKSGLLIRFRTFIRYFLFVILNKIVSGFWYL